MSTARGKRQSGGRKQGHVFRERSASIKQLRRELAGCRRRPTPAWKVVVATPFSARRVLAAAEVEREKALQSAGLEPSAQFMPVAFSGHCCPNRDCGEQPCSWSADALDFVRT